MNLNTTIESWSNVLIHPGAEAMEEERSRPQATLSTAIIWILVAAVVTGILGWLQIQMIFGSGNQWMEMIEQMDLPPEVATEIQTMVDSGMLGMLAGGGGLLGIILTPIFFLIGTGILHLIARMFGGSGDFGRFAYLSAAIQAPVEILSAVLSFVPVLGGCVSLALRIYSIVLLYFAIKVEYQLSDGRAIGTLLVPLVLLMGLAICGAAGLAGLMMSIQQGG